MYLSLSENSGYFPIQLSNYSVLTNYFVRLLHGTNRVFKYDKNISIQCLSLSANGCNYWGADKSLARPGQKQSWKHIRDARDFNKIETRAVINFLFLHGKVPKEIHAILTETLACFLPGRVKDISAPLYCISYVLNETDALRGGKAHNTK